MPDDPDRGLDTGPGSAVQCLAGRTAAAAALVPDQASPTRRRRHVPDDDRLPIHSQRVGLQPEHQRRGGRGDACRHRPRRRRPRPHGRRRPALGPACLARPGRPADHAQRRRVRAGDRVPDEPPAGVPGDRGPVARRDRERPDRPLGDHRCGSRHTGPVRADRRLPRLRIGDGQLEAPRHRAGSPSSSARCATARPPSTTWTCVGCRPSDADGPRGAPRVRIAVSAARGSPGCSGTAPASCRSPRPSPSRPTPASSARRGRCAPGRRSRRRAPCRGGST